MNSKSPAAARRVPGLDLFSQQPMFWAACAYAAGIIAAATFFRPLTWWLVAEVSFLLCAVIMFSRRAWVSALLTLTAFVSLGALHHELAGATAPAPPQVSAFTSGEEVLIIGHVVRTGLPRIQSIEQDRTERREVIDLETEMIESAAGKQVIAFGIRVTVRSQPSADNEELPSTAFRYGERVRFPAKLREPRNYGNPGAMDYRSYLRGKGIFALASVSVEKFESLDGSSGTVLGKWRNRARNAVAEAMLAAARPSAGSWLALSREDAALLLAMVIGEQSLLERRTRADFQRTGVFHILVVSGMNVGMLALFVYWWARKLRAGPWTATWVTVASTLAYVAVTDLDTPVVRAAIMLCLYMITRLLYRDRFSLNAVGIAAWTLLLYSPHAIFEPSFQLTFLSMVALSGIIQPLLHATSRPYEQALRGLELTGYDATLAPKLAQFRLDLRLIAEKAALLFSGVRGGWAYRTSSWVLTRCLAAGLALYDLVTVSIVMQLALALPMTLYFHRMALLGVPANILVMPLTALLLPAALIATLLQFLSSSLAAMVWGVAALCLHAITLVVQTGAGVQFADVRLARPEFSFVLLAAALFAAALLVVRRGRWGAAAGVSALFAAAILATLSPQPQGRPGQLEVTVIDVGQGDSILLVTPDGKRLLIDAGGPAGPFRTDNFDIGEDVVSPYLWSRGISRLDAVAVTHAHSDHLAGMTAIVANFRPRELWLGLESDNEAYVKVKAAAMQYGVVVKNFYAGDRVDFGKVRVEVLNPPRELIPKARGNEDSLVLQASFGETSVLLTGDAERKTEALVAAAASRASLLKVAHHGSGTSTTPELLARTQPRFAVISAGYRNLYGHPRADVLERLRRANVHTYRTDILGAVSFYLDGKAISAELPLP